MHQYEIHNSTGVFSVLSSFTSCFFFCLFLTRIIKSRERERERLSAGHRFLLRVSEEGDDGKGRRRRGASLFLYLSVHPNGGVVGGEGGEWLSVDERSEVTGIRERRRG